MLIGVKRCVNLISEEELQPEFVCRFKLELLVATNISFLKVHLRIHLPEGIFLKRGVIST